VKLRRCLRSLASWPVGRSQSVEEMEGSEVPNPITDATARLTKPGEGIDGDDEWPPEKEKEGPPTSQMPG
jgi:hypothetical protein